MKQIIIILLTVVATVADVAAQESNWFKRNHVCDDLEVAFSAGTTGLGFELAVPVTDWASLRCGWDGMPKFNIPLYFNITTYSEDGVGNNFQKVKDMMYKLTGDEIDEEVKMDARPNLRNFKLLVDIYPFKANRHWHVTTGFYLGESTIGRAISAKEETNSLVAMNLYNRIYDKLEESDGEAPIIGDIGLSPEKYQEIMSYGRVGIHIGDYKDGKPYYMMPKPNGTVSAIAVANRFKPYLGIGYAGAVDKLGRLKIGVDAGALFWGGAPDVITHDGTNISRDLVNVRGKVGDYLRLMNKLVVYPNVALRVSYTFF